MPPTEEHRKWVRDALGVTAGETSDTRPGGPSKDPVDEMIEEAIDDPEKRIKALATWKVPRYSDEYKDDTELTQFLDDLKTGTEKATEYYDYITKAAAYAEKYADLTGLEGVQKAAGGLKRVTEQISGGLGKFAKAVDKAKKIAVWVSAMDKFADASMAMDPRDRKSVERWVASLQRLWDASAPLAEWASSKAATAALGGSEAAGAAGATLAIVGAQLYVGIKVLEVGVKNVNAYLDRYDKIMKEIEREAGTAPPEERDPAPVYPGEWKSRKERAEDAKVREATELRNRIHAAKEAELEKKRLEIKAATEDFEKNVFPKIYLKHRLAIYHKIVATVRKRGGKTIEIVDLNDPAPPEYKWLDCILKADSTPLVIEEDGSSSDDRFYDRKARINVYPAKAKVSIEEAVLEIENFQHLSKPCPFFKELYDPELKKHLAKTVRFSASE